MTRATPFRDTIGKRDNPVFLKNVQMLRFLDPALHGLVLRCDLSQRIEVAESMDDSGQPRALQISRTTESDRRTLRLPLPPFTLPTLENSSETAACLIGVGNGIDLLLLFGQNGRDRALQGLKKSPLYVVEPDLHAFTLLLHLHDLRPLFASERLLLFVGEGCEAAFLQALQPHDRTLPGRVISQKGYDALHNDLLQRLTALDTAQSQRVALLKERLEHHYASEQRQREIADAFHRRSRPIRVLLISSRFTSFLQYCADALAHGFQQLGCRAELIMESDDLSEITMLFLLEKIEALDPDLIISLDHFRWEFGQLPGTIPFATWIQDLLPQMFADQGHVLGRHDHIFSLSSAWIERGVLSGPLFGDRPIHPLPVGVDTRTVRPLPEVEKDIDCLYVSNLPAPHLTFDPLRTGEDLGGSLFAMEASLIDAGLLTLAQLHHLYHHLLNELEQHHPLEAFAMAHDPERKQRFARRMLSEAAITHQDACLPLFISHAHTRMDWELFRRFKVAPILHLITNGIAVHIHGSNWQAIPGASGHCHGVVQNGEPLNRITARSRICLHNSGMSLHMRALEILGAGGFL
ncbi:MAG: hypothetical protein HQL50_15195, partial [Magnetococcales bacterium]|nr:hypothetical protein [Magnetococcales bacterium]